MTGILLAGVFATASIGGTSGLIEGNQRLLLIRLYGVAVTLIWSGGATYVLPNQVGAFVWLLVSREHELEGYFAGGEALQWDSPSSYLSPALPVGTIMSGVWRAYDLGGSG